MRILTPLLLAFFIVGCVNQMEDVGGVPWCAPSFIPPNPQPTTQVSVDGAGGTSTDRSGIKALPAQALYDPAYPKPSFVQPDELADRESVSVPQGSPSVYPTRGMAAQATQSPTLYPPTGRFNTEPGNPSVYPRGPLAPSGFRGP
jgi:hypothetical protein